eukprot:SAG31_NODE_199_length_20573_cov_5.832129_7_plen_88_part_00
MPAHALASAAGLLPCERRFLARTVDVGGASPVASLLEARRMVEEEGCTAVAVRDSFRESQQRGKICAVMPGVSHAGGRRRCGHVHGL